MIKLLSIKHQSYNKIEKIELSFMVNKKTEKIWFSWPEAKSSLFNTFDITNANIFMSSVLLPAMIAGQNIDVTDYCLSKKIIDSIEKIQQQYLNFFPNLGLKKIKLFNFRVQDKSNKLTADPLSTVSFFTGGVDSFDTLISNNRRIRHLIYVYGFDIHRRDKELLKTVNKQFKTIEKSFKKDFIFITTNLREFTEKYITWDVMHGAGLVTIGYLFEGSPIKVVLIPAGNSSDLSVPSGSHPFLEPNFSSDKIDFVCDGSDKKRIDKIIGLKRSKIALENLRVCWKNSGNKLNCGVCEKCSRTMLGLSIAGLLDQTKIFNRKLDNETISSIKITNDIVALFYREMLPYLKDQPILDKAKEYLTKELERFDSINQEVVTPKPFVKNKNILFVDFNGVISYKPFWFSLKDNEKYSKHYLAIEDFLFKKNRKLISDWMIGNYTSEEIHDLLQKELNIPEEIFSMFSHDCKNLDISMPILNKIKELRKFYYCILATDNMDSFSRFTLPNHKELIESFDEINDSYTMKQSKPSFEGLYFKNKVAERKSIIENSILIDDSLNNCNVFESIGGQYYQVKNESEALEALSLILSKVENKWEWQY